MAKDLTQVAWLIRYHLAENCHQGQPYPSWINDYARFFTRTYELHGMEQLYEEMEGRTTSSMHLIDNLSWLKLRHQINQLPEVV